jgi:pSer/pThr/pTyr-binding forkhead associated (FHA) protein
MLEQPETSLVLILQMGSERVARELSDGETTIGRAADCHIPIPLPQVSSKHARIVKEGDCCFLEDLGSRNGTFVNGQRISTRVSLSPGDVVMLGQDVRLDLVTQSSNAAAAVQIPLAVPPVTLVSDETQLDIRGTIKRSTRFGLLDADPEAKLNAVLEIGTALAGHIDLPTLCTKILDTIFQIFRLADRGCIMLKDRTSGELVPRAVKFRDEDSEDTLPGAKATGAKPVLLAQSHGNVRPGGRRIRVAAARGRGHSSVLRHQGFHAEKRTVAGRFAEPVGALYGGPGADDRKDSQSWRRDCRLFGRFGTGVLGLAHPPIGTAFFK